MQDRIVIYRRVSTQQQGKSGLGLEGQHTAVQDFATRTGAKIVATYTEIESGKRSDRPELLKAMAHARRSQATLLVAKLDRLSRNVAFLSALMESGVDFVCCDNPSATKLTIHILVSVAEDEAERIKERTKAALAAAKARGTLLGSARPGHWDGREAIRDAALAKGRALGVAKIKANADALYRDLYGRMTELRTQGATLQSIADTLNAEGHTTRRLKPWNATQVMRVLERAAVVAA